jgi:hypothetical protein
MCAIFRRGLIVLVVPALAVGLWIGRSWAQNPPAGGNPQGVNTSGNRMGPNQARWLGQYVKLGSYRINISQVLYMKEEGKTLLVSFGRGAEVRLEGAEAEGLRHWIDLGSGYPIDAP